ncbi:ABC-type multidrug transport system, ATPase component [Clostridium pasteurianum DSM 525 = ATCC 6013]|uniref:ABC transporter related protein n=1 Tax=Clostridium pasteurianum DSM 525 = ATCC 6013 TaxID=1262449 RepID=A0A0H3J966_CLOPA|nr:ATP-binding cassette domain-containing protein [Clostridium pasteurianum]AJA49817.1 ABC-type multidrug transport system, ATPase component [Clostridium pasteurianum DSM 525 = ATCC 6013]AJA53805.1 ABC-type multidrug transport system, ATPase component [Clostridium pasteurianum DSM 525 = ATCC 6013]AOZ76962.1 hypothetical protein AQ983_18375 [Clostridium pasteurianum DSM 525 = ATCC 6013]AOZ80759.1 hypothetical protein AQ984_18370 [Clostridium pasteurianum]ELP57775.1 ABC transporter ATP-binding p
MELINLSKKYENLLFKNINYKFTLGKIYSIFGKNGIGKTTLLDIISGFNKADNGYIDYGDLKDEIMYIGENPIPFELLTGKEFVITTLEFKDIKIDDCEIDSLFKKFEIEDFKDNIINTYSKGMKYKLLIIIILISKPKVLILDEPLVDIDIITIENISQIFHNIKDSIIIFSTHISNIAFKLSDEILYLTQNGIINVTNNFKSSEEIENYILNLMKDGRIYEK